MVEVLFIPISSLPLTSPKTLFSVSFTLFGFLIKEHSLGLSHLKSVSHCVFLSTDRERLREIERLRGNEKEK